MGKEINWVGATYRYLKVLYYKEKRKETGGKKRRKTGNIQLPDSSIFWINLKHLKGKVKYVIDLWLVIISNSPPGFTHGKARFTTIEMSFSMEKLSRIPIRISNKQIPFTTFRKYLCSADCFNYTHYFQKSGTDFFQNLHHKNSVIQRKYCDFLIITLVLDKYFIEYMKEEHLV